MTMKFSHVTKLIGQKATRPLLVQDGSKEEKGDRKRFRCDWTTKVNYTIKYPGTIGLFQPKNGVLSAFRAGHRGW